VKIIAIELIRYGRGIRVHAGEIDWLWVRLHADNGLTGLGETYPCAAAEAAVIRQSLAGVLLGRDARQIDRLWQEMFLAVSYHGWAGAEMRAISAVDMALWDLAGKSAGLPVYQLLGGMSSSRISVFYNAWKIICGNSTVWDSSLQSKFTFCVIWSRDNMCPVLDFCRA